MPLKQISKIACERNTEEVREFIAWQPSEAKAMGAQAG